MTICMSRAKRLGIDVSILLASANKNYISIS